MADSSTEKKRVEEYGVRTVKGRWSEWSMDGNGIDCETKEQTSGLSMEDLAWLIEPHREALALPEPATGVASIREARERVELAEAIVNAVLSGLSDRGAIDVACATWGASVHQEIRRELTGKVADLLSLPEPAAVTPVGEVTETHQLRALNGTHTRMAGASCPCEECQLYLANEALAQSDMTERAYTRTDVARAWTQGHNAGSTNRFLSENPYDNHLNPLRGQKEPR